MIKRVAAKLFMADQPRAVRRSATFSANGSNAAKSTQVTFSKAGEYELRVTITDKVDCRPALLRR